MSALCHKQTSNHSLDHLVSGGQKRRRYREAERLGGFQMERWKGISIDENLKFDAVQQPARCSLFQFWFVSFLSHHN